MTAQTSQFFTHRPLLLANDQKPWVWWTFLFQISLHELSSSNNLGCKNKNEKFNSVMFSLFIQTSDSIGPSEGRSVRPSDTAFEIFFSSFILCSFLKPSVIVWDIHEGQNFTYIWKKETDSSNTSWSQYSSLTGPVGTEFCIKKVKILLSYHFPSV